MEIRWSIELYPAHALRICLKYSFDSRHFIRVSQSEIEAMGDVLISKWIDIGTKSVRCNLSIRVIGFHHSTHRSNGSHIRTLVLWGSQIMKTLCISRVTITSGKINSDHHLNLHSTHYILEESMSFNDIFKRK